ncbi:MAG: polynucleotide adenylyltransferase PcnB, partial [Caldimonas sp.]
EQPRFRAGLDFLRLRGETGEVEPELAHWWEEFWGAGDEHRHEMLGAVRERDGVRRAPAPRAAAPSRAAAPRAEPAGGSVESPAESPAQSPDESGLAPAKKRRRRRRKPAGSAQADAVDGDSSPAAS